jgi:hypothetical protein
VLQNWNNWIHIFLNGNARTRTSERVGRLSALIRSPRLSRLFICSFHLCLARFHPFEPSMRCGRWRALSSRRRPQGAPPRAPHRIRGGCAGGDGPREIRRELRVQDAAPHASLTSPLPIPLFTAAMRASEVGQPMRSHASRTQRPHAGREELLPCVGRAVRRGRRGGAPPTAQPPPMPTGWSSPTGGRIPGRRRGPRSSPAASRRSTHGQGTPDAKDLPPVFSGIFMLQLLYISVVTVFLTCCNRSSSGCNRFSFMFANRCAHVASLFLRCCKCLMRMFQN